MKELNVKFKVPESREEVEKEARKYWLKLSKFVDAVAEVIADKIKSEVSKNGSH